MNLIWFVLFLICGSREVTLAVREVHSGRIPANVEILPKSELKRSHFRLIPSNEEGISHPRSGPQTSKLKTEYEATSEIRLPPPLNNLDPEHKILYLRALEKNYDYAQFGEPCKVFTADELEAFLGILEESIQPHEGESKSRLISPQEKGEQLEQLFFHSRAICDYRNLLTCHKQFLTCACAHSSMGVNRDGLCGINIGHSCEFSEKKLRKFGIPMMPEMSPLKCLLENAECEMDSENDLLGAGISPIRKVCKCRKGFWGATCGRSHDPSGIKLVPSKDQRKADKKFMETNVRTEDLSEEMELGRPIWMTDGDMASGEYFMHPEEIRDKLVELMDEAHMYIPGHRKQEANKLVTSLETDVDKEEMIVNELRLRQLATLNHGDACDPERQVILDNPPVAKDDLHRWTDPHPQDIKSWHLSLLQAKKPLCNAHRLLRCNEVSKICECKPGLELDPKGRNSSTPCKIPLGNNCDEDFDPILEFDPLKDRKRFSEMIPPSCMPGTECIDKPLFFQKKCWCSPQSGKCDKKDFDEDLYSSMVKAIRSRFLLGLGDSCDPKLHRRLLSFENDEDPGYEKRLQFFRDILDNPESQLCDIVGFLNCSETSRTCECWKQLEPIQRENGDVDCVAMNMGSCGRTFKYGKYMYSKEDAQLWQVEKALQLKFLPGCVPGALCTGGNNAEWAGRCLCLNSKKTGESCDDRKSILGSAFKASRIPQNDDEEVATLRVYFDLNAHTLLMEQLMTAGINDVCDPGTGLTLDRIIKFWKEIASSNDTDSERRTLPYYIAATKWTKFLISTVEGNSASLCNATVGLRCHRTTGRCGCHRGSRWNGDKCYLEADEQCDPNPGAVWVTRCAPGTGCKAVDDRRYKVYKCTACQQNKDGSCTRLQQDDDDEEEEIWDTWNVKDDDKVEEERMQVADTEGEVGLGEEKIVQKREDGEHLPAKEKVKNYFVIKTTNEPEKLDDTFGDPQFMDREAIIKENEIISDTSSPPASEVKLRGRARYLNLKKDNLDDLNKHQKDAYILEINRMLKEILEYRNVPFGGPCNIDDEEKLVQMFPSLPIYDLDHLTSSLPMVYILLSRLYWKGMSFCNRNQFLKCTNEEVCGCSFGFGLVEEEGECRLKEHSYCERELVEAGKRSSDFASETKNSRKNRHPVFSCQRGTTCVQIDYGLPVCVKNDDLDVDGKRQGKIFGRPLFIPNDDFPRSGNDTGEDKQSGSGWAHQQVYFVGIVAVAIRLIVLWVVL